MGCDAVKSSRQLTRYLFIALPNGYHLDVVGGPSTPHDPESDAGGSLSSWQSYPNR
jgi:hypothetical protein